MSAAGCRPASKTLFMSQLCALNQDLHRHALGPLVQSFVLAFKPPGLKGESGPGHASLHRLMFRTLQYLMPCPTLLVCCRTECTLERHGRIGRLPSAEHACSVSPDLLCRSGDSLLSPPPQWAAGAYGFLKRVSQSLTQAPARYLFQPGLA